MKDLSSAALLRHARVRTGRVRTRGLAGQAGEARRALPAGGEADFLARVLAQKMSEGWSQAVLVENRPGATGNIGTEFVAKSPPDGYTLLIGSDIQFAISPASGVKLPYDPEKDFEPVSIIVLANLVLLAHPSLAASNVQELVALAKSRPGKINYASTGTGGNDHLGFEILKLRGGFDLTHVPYKGQGAALPDLVSGRVQLAMFGIASTLPYVKTGKLKALAVASAKRVAVLPDVPTIAESAFPGFRAEHLLGCVCTGRYTQGRHREDPRRSRARREPCRCARATQCRRPGADRRARPSNSLRACARSALNGPR